MKKIIALIFLSAAFMFSCSKGEENLNNPVDNVKKGIGDVPGTGDRLIMFGTYCKPCDCDGDGETDGCDGDKGICLIVRFGIDNQQRPLNDRIGVGRFTFNGLGNDIILSMEEDATPPDPNVDQYFHVNEDMIIPEDVIAGGYVIEQGVYPIDYSTNLLGDVVLSSN